MAMFRRRRLLQFGMGSLAAGFAPGLSLFGKNLPAKRVRIGLIADLHHQFVDGGEKRLEAFLEDMETTRPDALLQLGDFTFPNAGGEELAESFNGAHDTTLHAIGNHDLDLGLTRQHCLDAWGMPAAYYRHDLAGIRLLVLDGNEKGSPDHGGGYPKFVGDQQLEWLKAELEESALPVIIASHQPLAGPFAIDNAAAVQALLTAHHERILLCLNGHTHLDHQLEVGGVTYLHLNSATYYWVGGTQRMLYYRDPLFATLTIDPGSATATLAGERSVWDGPDPDKIEYYQGEHADLRGKVTASITDRTFHL